jgi:FAD/FMN-containing dehydrogenase
LEHTLRQYHGRPHWGKAHTASADQLAPLYPRWTDFQRVRASLDPDGVFSNDYARRVLGPVQVPVVAGGEAA